MPVKQHRPNLFSSGKKNQKNKYEIDFDKILKHAGNIATKKEKNIPEITEEIIENKASDRKPANDKKPSIDRQVIDNYFSAYNKLREDYVKSDLDDNMFILEKMFSDEMIEKAKESALKMAAERGFTLDENLSAEQKEDISKKMPYFLRERMLIPDERTFLSLNSNPKLAKFLEMVRKVEQGLREKNLSPMQLLDHLNEVQSLGHNFATLFKKTTGMGANSTPGTPGMAMVLSTLQQFTTTCSMLGLAIRSYVKADNKLKVDNWIEANLVNRLILVNKIQELSAIQNTTLKTKKPLNEDELYKLEKVIFTKNLTEAKKLSPKKYRSLLEKEMWLGNNDELLPYLKDNKSAMSLFIQLELRHLKRRKLELEDLIMLRLKVNLNEMHPYTKNNIAKNANRYVYDDPNFRNSMESVLKEDFVKCSEKMIQQEDVIIKSLKAKKTKREKDMLGRGFLFLSVAAGVVLVMASLFCVPPIGLAILITLAAISLVALAVAKIFKPDILKDLTNGFKNIKHKVSKEFNFWQTKTHAENVEKYREDLAQQAVDAIMADKGTAPKS